MSTHHHLWDKKNGNADHNAGQRIIVIGASSGGIEPIKKIIESLPQDFDIPIFIVWHMSPSAPGMLPLLLNRKNKIFAANAHDKEPIEPHRIYVARPDYHLVIEDKTVHVTHGPKENGFRPAIDPLFRSAAYAYGSGVIGIILSGALDDGTAGLWAVKHFGGTAIVQDPADAQTASMPASALRNVKVDYCLPVSQIADLLVRLSKKHIKKINVMKDEQTKKEIDISAEKADMNDAELSFGELTPFTCPECHGVLSRLHNDNIIRYRCHTGHSYSLDSLIIAISGKIEDTLYSAIRCIDEMVILLNHLGRQYAETNRTKLAEVYFQKAKEAYFRSQLVRKAVIGHEYLSREKLEQEAATEKQVKENNKNGKRRTVNK